MSATTFEDGGGAFTFAGDHRDEDVARGIARAALDATGRIDGLRGPGRRTGRDGPCRWRAGNGAGCGRPGRGDGSSPGFSRREGRATGEPSHGPDVEQ
jgi:hypothetical protein